MPTAAPMMVDSEIGVSITRAAPNSPFNPLYCWKIPPVPTSSPITTTFGSARIASRTAAQAASA